MFEYISLKLTVENNDGIDLVIDFNDLTINGRRLYRKGHPDSTSFFTYVTIVFGRDKIKIKKVETDIKQLRNLLLGIQNPKIILNFIDMLRSADDYIISFLVFLGKNNPTNIEELLNQPIPILTLTYTDTKEHNAVIMALRDNEPLIYSTINTMLLNNDSIGKLLDFKKLGDIDRRNADEHLAETILTYILHKEHSIIMHSSVVQAGLYSHYDVSSLQRTIFNRRHELSSTTLYDDSELGSVISFFKEALGGEDNFNTYVEKMIRLSNNLEALGNEFDHALTDLDNAETIAENAYKFFNLFINARGSYNMINFEYLYEMFFDKYEVFKMIKFYSVGDPTRPLRSSNHVNTAVLLYDKTKADFYYNS